MHSKTTAIWFTVAAALFAFIFFFERFMEPPTAATMVTPISLALPPA